MNDKERVEFFIKSQKELFDAVKKMEGRLGVLILRAIAKMETDQNGALKNNGANIKIVTRLLRLLGSSIDASRSAIGRRIFDSIKTLFNLNTAYFERVIGKTVGEKIENRALAAMLKSLGTTTEGTILKGGYIDVLTSSQAIVKNVGLVIINALKKGQPLIDFAKDFKVAMGRTLGIVARHYYTKAFTLYQTFDRTIQAKYADELGLKYAIYSGTLKSNTRDFCAARVNNVYDSNEIKNWARQKWIGKIEGSDIRTTCGGYNCRHHLSWVSKELANVIAAQRGGLNKYN
ncbi:MAG: hypothetical protein U5L45_00420 [Saprospiraceae bacterium]|nr:hypothetical protein [Saprospiraceae bacterium]